MFTESSKAISNPLPIPDKDFQEATIKLNLEKSKDS
jgi:hypothetical protein